MRRSQKPDCHELVRRAEAQLAKRKAREAADLSGAAAKKDPNHVPALEVLARAHWQLEDFKRVEEITRRLIRLDGFNPGYRILRGVALQALGRIGEAVKSFESAARLDPAGKTNAADMIQEARAWQSNTIGRLISEDATFAALYRRDPAEACAKYGFEFLATSDGIRAWVVEQPQPLVLRARPS